MVSSLGCAKIGCKMYDYVATSGMSESGINMLELSRITRNYQRGDLIFKQASPSQELYCLRSGQVLLSHTDAFGHKTAFRVAGPREIIGFRSFFGEDDHAATAEALTNCTICLHTRPTINKLIDTCPGFARVFMRTLARDRGPADALVLRGQHVPVRTRLVYLLLIMKDRQGVKETKGNLSFELPVLRRDIAALLGARAESVTRAISELKKDGVVTIKNRTVTIPSLKRLYAETQRGAEAKAAS